MDVLMEMTWSDDIRRKGSRLAVPHFVSCLAWLWHPAQLAAGQWDGPGVKHCAVRTTSGRYLTVISQSGVLQGWTSQRGYHHLKWRGVGLARPRTRTRRKPHALVGLARGHLLDPGGLRAQRPGDVWWRAGGRAKPERRPGGAQDSCRLDQRGSQELLGWDQWRRRERRPRDWPSGESVPGRAAHRWDSGAAAIGRAALPGKR